MLLEQGTTTSITIGFFIILSIVFIYLILLFTKRKNKGLLWFIPQLAMLILCFYFFISLINTLTTVPTAMLSEENSLLIGCLSISWALSMLFMILGITSITKNKAK